MPLHLVWKYKHLDIVKFILNNVDDPFINKQRDNGLTPLMYAWMGGNKEIVKQLLENEADPLIKTKNNTTALYLAAK